MADTFTVWRCRHCSTLNALEKVDYARIYKNYPIQRQGYNLFSKWMNPRRCSATWQSLSLPKEVVRPHPPGWGFLSRVIWGFLRRAAHAHRAVINLWIKYL